MGDAIELIRRTYRSFNDRDIDATLAAMHEDVDWPNGWEGGRVKGHREVAEYWTRQWKEIDPNVEPTEIVELPDGRVRVRVHQVVRNLDGQVVADGEVFHVFSFRDGLVTAMNIEG